MPRASIGRLFLLAWALTVSPPSALPAIALGAAALSTCSPSWRGGVGGPGSRPASWSREVSGLRLYASCDDYLHASDSDSAAVARNLMAHPLRPTLYETPLLPLRLPRLAGGRVWLRRPPLVLWLMALAMARFGVGELALRLPEPPAVIGGHYATYRIGLAFRGHDVGLVARRSSTRRTPSWCCLPRAGCPPTTSTSGSSSFVTLAAAAGVAVRPRPASFVATAGLLSGLALLSRGTRACSRFRSSFSGTPGTSRRRAGRA